MPASLFYYGPVVKRLRQRPLTPLTWVRFPHGSPKNAPQLRLGSFFGASVRGIEQDGRPQAAKNNPADCFLVRGRWTHGSPKRYLARSCGVFFIAVFRKAGAWCAIGGENSSCISGCQKLLLGRALLARARLSVRQLPRKKRCCAKLAGDQWSPLHIQ